ncbi:MAG: hypothetical protein ABIO60_10620 [Aquaticitalea sp.]
MKHSVLFLIITISINAVSQNKEMLSYHELPEYPETFTAGTVAARMIDALGFRYYWATDGLTESDLEYQPNEDVRSTSETVDHVLNLSFVIVNATLKQANGSNDISLLSFEEKRQQTLVNLKTASDILRTSDDISQFKILFGKSQFPFWNQINGPVADAIWHCGQIASFRRSSGNPINPKIDHFNGTVKD